ncbi:MAG: RsmE family RNA methyltransferase [Candidatus Paceibacterota bacterium]|jgi:16S rRNA (uracil1498-N3)-methyltransferase
MRQNRFYIEGELEGPLIELADLGVLNQLKNVLRSKIGDEIIIFNGRGVEYQARIKDFKKGSVELELIKRELRKAEGPEVCLYLAILKKENFELAVQKAVESGVNKIIPIITERTVKLGLKTERLNLIIKEATEQSGRAFLPELGVVINFDEAVRVAQASKDLNIFCDLTESGDKKILQTSNKINVFVGPEGGWSEGEQKLARSAEFNFYSLGEYVLRAETSAIVASWLAVNKKL